jgi:hypothetical protein
MDFLCSMYKQYLLPSCPSYIPAKHPSCTSCLWINNIYLRQVAWPSISDLIAISGISKGTWQYFPKEVRSHIYYLRLLSFHSFSRLHMERCSKPFRTLQQSGKLNTNCIKQDNQSLNILSLKLFRSVEQWTLRYQTNGYVVAIHTHKEHRNGIFTLAICGQISVEPWAAKIDTFHYYWRIYYRSLELRLCPKKVQFSPPTSITTPSTANIFFYVMFMFAK